MDTDPAVVSLAAALRDHFETCPDSDLPAEVVGAGPAGKLDWSKIPWDRVAELVFRILPIFFVVANGPDGPDRGSR